MGTKQEMKKSALNVSKNDIVLTFSNLMTFRFWQP